MAIALFRKDTTAPVTFFRVFATQSLVTEYGYTNTNIYKSVTITDAEFNDIRTNVRVPESVDSDDNITWQTDEDTPSWSKEAFEYNLKQTIAALKHVNEMYYFTLVHCLFIQICITCLKVIILPS